MNTRQSNIFDPIMSELDQRVFKGETPRSGVIKFILKLRDDILGQYIPNPEQYFKVFITGSLTTYQYAETSDMDMTYFPNYHALQHLMTLESPGEVRKNLIQIVIDQMDGRFIPGTLHPIQNFIAPPDAYPQDMYKPGLRSAWDLQNNVWFVAPEKDRVHDVSRELPVLYQRAEDMADKMEQMLDHDTVYAKQLFKQIHRKRTLDQQRGLGDFSEGNVVYKYLLHKGLFDRLRNELGVYIARRDNGKEESIQEEQGLVQGYSFLRGEDALESIAKTQEHVAANEGDEYNWPDLEILHDISLKAVENHMGYRDTGLLEGAVGNTQMQQMYGAHEDIFDTAANLLAKIQRQQAVVEGNKRTATATALSFLERNGYDTSALAQNPIWEKLVEVIYHISDAVEANEDKYIPMLADMFRKYCKPMQKTAATQRMFIAFDLPENVINSLMQWQKDNLPEGVIPQSLTNLHMTLAFLGDIDKSMIPKLTEVLSKLDHNNVELTGPIEYRELDRLAFLVFEEQGGQEVWAQLNQELKELTGYEPQFSPWLSHVTIWNYKDQPKPNINPQLPQSTTFNPIGTYLYSSVGNPYGTGTFTKIGAPKNIADEPVKVIYDFEGDKILLGTPGQVIPRKSRIVGDYDGSNINLYSTGQEFLNSNYLKRLWHASFPTRPLNNISFEDEQLKVRS